MCSPGQMYMNLYVRVSVRLRLCVKPTRILPVVRIPIAIYRSQFGKSCPTHVQADNGRSSPGRKITAPSRAICGTYCQYRWSRRSVSDAIKPWFRLVCLFRDWNDCRKVTTCECMYARGRLKNRVSAPTVELGHVTPVTPAFRQRRGDASVLALFRNPLRYVNHHGFLSSTFMKVQSDERTRT